MEKILPLTPPAFGNGDYGTSSVPWLSTGFLDK
jgi:hypothetical protein